MPITLVKDLDVNPRITAAAENGGFKLITKILEANTNDLKNLCRLNENDVGRLVEAAARACSPPIRTAYFLNQSEEYISSSITTGCKVLDNFFGNGLPCVGITEIAGESGTGKTQLGLQLALSVQLNKSDGGIAKNVVYICTEGQFPVNRLQQLVSVRSDKVTYNRKNFLDNIIVEHLPDIDQLRDWLDHRLQTAIAKRNIGCIVIDSIAAVFRSYEGLQRDKNVALTKIAAELHKRATQDKCIIIAINQAAAAVGGNHYGLLGNNIPALGLSWTNFVTTRLMANKTGFVIGECDSIDNGARVRSLDILHNPWLPRKSCPFIVTSSGVRGVDTSKECLKAEECNYEEYD